MTTGRIKFATDILRRLGEELNPSIDRGIVELVKNAYDADARKCSVTLQSVEAAGGAVEVSDDGDGMTVDEIVKGWLVLGRSGKTATRPTRLGRVPVGNKGLGRLAAIRLGDSVDLQTVSRKTPRKEHRLPIHWPSYDSADLVDDVGLEIATRQSPRAIQSGTRIRVSNLHRRVGRNEVKRLARELLLLADPFGDDPSGFAPELHAPEFQDLENLVARRYFREAEFHLNVRTDASGKAHAKVLDFNGKALFNGTHKDLRPQIPTEPYRCPPAKFDLWAFLLNRDAFLTRAVTIGEVRSWLANFGGVHVYQNGLRVSPYGDPGNDWLELNLMRARSPEYMPSTNTSIGRVMFEDTEGHLVQKTDRSGFIENDAYASLRHFAIDGLRWMQRERLAQREKKRVDDRAQTAKKSSRSRKKIEEVIKETRGSTKPALEAAFERYDRSRDLEVRELRREVQLYRTLSTAGITSAVFAHESASSPTKIIAGSAKTIRTRTRKLLGLSVYDEKIAPQVERILGAVDSLQVLSGVTLGLVDHEKRRSGNVPLHRVIREVVKVYEPFLAERHTTVDTDFAAGNPRLLGARAAVECIVTNLINNAMRAFEDQGPGDRRILIRTTVEDSYVELSVLDNGPGILGIAPESIWLPGETTRVNGTGLGLTIVRDSTVDLGGSVSAIESGELGGAQMIIQLPTL